MGFLARLSSEWSYLTGLRRALARSGAVLKAPHTTAREAIEEAARRHGDRMAFISTPESYTYRQLDARTNQYARFCFGQGLAKGDTVALFMPNRAEYIAIWMGTIKAGCVSAWLNTGLTGPSLTHCLQVAQAKILVVDTALLSVIDAVRADLPATLKIFVYGERAGCGDARLDQLVGSMSAAPLIGGERPELNIDDRAVYVYTSGTTGLPKAANINHSRLLRIMHGFSGAIAARAGDRMYIALPLYHSTGGICATGAVFTVGGAAVIADKFSARQFWGDIIAHQCTMFVYVGELCRYLVANPPSAQERAHKLRMCFGNGLREDVFEQVQRRFGVKNILEFYGATEGNISLFNFDSKPGSVGRIPKWAEGRYAVKIVRYDSHASAPARGPDGRSIECAPGETGEIMAQIVNDPRQPSNKFDGYADKAATEKKIVRDAFATGDAWFRSGDLLKRDAMGYFYFVDRIGDTYRWKGENVSTGEVTTAITSFPGVEDANVYGVAIEGREGRAGMAAVALLDPDHFDLAALRAHLTRRLPEFARPVFLRLQNHIDLTGTFKQRKVDLVADGFDPEKTKDPIYLNDPRAQAFVRIDRDLRRDIESGAVRL